MEPDFEGTIAAAGGTFRLRPARESDMPAMLATAQDLWLGIPDPNAARRAEFVVREFARGWDGFFGLARVVVGEESDELVAQVCLIRRSPSRLEVTYGVAPEHRGRGIATAVLEFVTERALGPITDRIEAIIDPRNQASVRVVTKAGYRYAGRNSDHGHSDLLYVREQ